MARRIIAWECKYCGAIKKTELICKRHEISCMSNSSCKNCLVCVHCRADRICNIRGCKCSRAISANCDYFERNT